MSERPLFIGPPVIEDPSLSKKIQRLCQEKIVQKDFLQRNQWEEKLAESLAFETTMVVIIDLVGGRRLEETFQSRMQNVLNGIEKWRGKIGGITPGRRIEENERLPGQDEVLLIVPQSTEFSFLEILEELSRAVGPDLVYVAASINQKGTPKEEALKAADVGLRRIKEEAKRAEGKSCKAGVVIVSSGKVEYNGQEIDKSELSTGPTRTVFPEFIISREATKQLRQFDQLTVLSPRRMADINAAYGMDGGDKILLELAKKIKSALERKGGPEQQIYKIGTTFVIPNTKLTQQELTDLANGLPYGLAYSQLTSSAK